MNYGQLHALTEVSILFWLIRLVVFNAQLVKIMLFFLLKIVRKFFKSKF